MRDNGLAVSAFVSGAQQLTGFRHELRILRRFGDKTHG
jgi:hypothetical protein